MGQEQGVWIPLEDSRFAVAPSLQIDVGRRGRRHHVLPAATPDSGGVAHERNAARRVEVADVMGGVPGRVGHLERPPRYLEPFTTLQYPEPVGWHCQELAPQPLHVLPVEAR